LLKNYLNANDIYPILDLIRSEIKKNNYDRDRVNWGKQEAPVPDKDNVVSIEPVRGGSSYDPDMITAILITYASGATENVTLHRGYSPPVHRDVPNYDYINNVLITGITIQYVSGSGGAGSTVTIDLVRENGYGQVTKVNLTYS
jgi:hypothetical protein